MSLVFTSPHYMSLESKKIKLSEYQNIFGAFFPGRKKKS